jgi:hypothetical protein
MFKLIYDIDPTQNMDPKHYISCISSDGHMPEYYIYGLYDVIIGYFVKIELWKEKKDE